MRQRSRRVCTQAQCFRKVCRNPSVTLCVGIGDIKRTVHYLTWNVLQFRYPSYNMARALQMNPFVLTGWTTDVEILDTELVMSTILIRIHSLRSNRLTRTHFPLDLAPRWVPCGGSSNQNGEALHNGFDPPPERHQSTMRHSADSVNQATIQLQNVRSSASALLDAH